MTKKMYFMTFDSLALKKSVKELVPILCLMMFFKLIPLEVS